MPRLILSPAAWASRVFGFNPTRQHDIHVKTAGVRKRDTPAAAIAVYRGNAGAEMPGHAQCGELALQQRATCRRQQARQRLLRDVDDVDPETGAAEVVRKLAADQSGADDRDCALALDCGAKPRVVFETVDRHYAFHCGAGERQADLVGAERQHQLRVAHGFIADPDRVSQRIEGGHTGARAYRGVELVRHLLRGVHRDALGRLAGRKHT